MAYNQIRIMKTIRGEVGTMPETHKCNAFLKFLGGRVRAVQFFYFGRTRALSMIVRYNSSDSYENKVDNFFNTL